MSSGMEIPKLPQITANHSLKIKNLLLLPQREPEEDQALGCNSPAQGSQSRRHGCATALRCSGPKEFLGSRQAQGWFSSSPRGAELRVTTRVGAGIYFPKAMESEKHKQIFKSSFPILFPHSMTGCLLPEA